MYKAAVVEAPGKLVIKQLPIPKATTDKVVIKVEACGVCHSDDVVMTGHWYTPIKYPRVPGHEVIGRVTEIGPAVKGFKVGTRVGVGWHGGHCMTCTNCRRGNFTYCATSTVCGIDYDGGYGEYMMAPEDAVARIPEDVDAAEAAPLLCAGVTVYNSLRHQGGLGGEVCAVLGLGGLGHLAVQFARKLGYITVVISSGDDKKALAFELGAHHYINGSTQNVVAELMKLGGAKVILATAPSTKATEAALPGLATGGKLMILGIDPKPLQVSSGFLIGKQATIIGWYAGIPTDGEDTVNFAKLSGVKPMIEKYKLEDAQKAQDSVLTSKARFRPVIIY